jgi:hypothetical protein
MAELDKLSLDMIECKKAGFGCHYGSWKATQNPVKTEKKDLPEGWRVCAYCGTAYKPTSRRPQTYCGAYCQRQAFDEKTRGKRTRGAEDGTKNH